MFCVHCGEQIHDEAVICVKCGCKVVGRENTVQLQAQGSDKDEIMSVVVKVFLILGCIAQGWLLLPLAWCIPMTVKIFNCLKTGRPIGTGLKVCTLLFVSLVSGICLLCMDDT